MSTAGLIGLGIIGERVAQNLSKSGIEVWVWNRTPKPFPRSLGSPRALAERTEILLLFVKDGAALLETTEAMLPALTPAHLVINHATVAPDDAIRASEIAAERGASFLDAPFTGSRDAAANNELVYYLGGEDAVIERARPLLELTSKLLLPIGKTGDASLIKVATNMVSAAIVSALSESLALVEASGLDGQLLATAIAHNAARSGVGDMKLPAMLARDFTPRFSMANMTKDMRIAARLLETKGIPSHIVSAFLSHAKTAEDKGLSQQDFSALVEACRSGIESVQHAPR